MARLITTDGVTIKDYPCETLEKMQWAVGGYIEPLYTSDWVVLVNEEGLIKNLPINPKVSGMCGQVIVGDCLVLTHKEWNDKN